MEITGSASVKDFTSLVGFMNTRRAVLLGHVEAAMRHADAALAEFDNELAEMFIDRAHGYMLEVARIDGCRK